MEEIVREYRGVPVPEELQDVFEIEEAGAWRRGVDNALASRRDIPSDSSALKITGWTKGVVRAFAHVVEDDPDTAVRIVADMPPKDRAVLSFWLRELEEIVDSAETARRTDTDTLVRETVRSLSGVTDV